MANEGERRKMRRAGEEKEDKRKRRGPNAI